MKRLIASGVLLGFLGLGLAVGHAQHAPSGAGHEMDHARMAQMMKMMGDMQEQMKGIQEQMQGRGPMHGRIEQMMGEMARMRAMMEQHHGQMMQQCPGAGVPAAPSK